MKTWPLDYTTWDLKFDAAHNWNAIDSEADVAAQSVANAWLLFTNDSFLFPAEGIPYKLSILGRNPPESLVKAHLKRMALTVPVVVGCEIQDYKYDDRLISANGIIYTVNGRRAYVNI